MDDLFYIFLRYTYHSVTAAILSGNVLEAPPPTSGAPGGDLDPGYGVGIVRLNATPGSGFSSPWAMVFTDLAATRRLIFSDQADQARCVFARSTIPQIPLARNFTRAATLPARAGPTISAHQAQRPPRRPF